MSIASDVGVTDRDTASGDGLVRDRAVRLFRYLAALAELRSKTVRDLASYEAVFSISELPQEKECYCAGWDGTDRGEEHWLRIDKPNRPQAPRPPDECEHWFNETDLSDASAEPKLLGEIPDPDWHAAHRDEDTDLASPPKLLLIDRPNVSAAWLTYLEQEWRPWRAEQQRYETVQAAYRKLFAIYQEQQRRGEQYELILGIGTLLWTSRSGHKINRPIVTARVSICLEAASGQITVSPIADGTAFALEQDMLEVSERPPIEEQQNVEKALVTLDSPWVRDAVTPILKGWLNALPAAADGVYDDTLIAPTGPSRVPRMCFAPILVLRRRGGRSMRDALKKIETRLAAGGRLRPAFGFSAAFTSDRALRMVGRRDRRYSTSRSFFHCRQMTSSWRSFIGLAVTQPSWFRDRRERAKATRSLI